MVRKKKVLIVEDDQSLVQLLKVNLEAAGYLTLTVYDGKRAVSVASFEHPDLILLDVGLPGLSGFEVAAALKKDIKTRYLPIIFLTAYAEREDKLKGFNLEAEDYITKPFDPDELMARVERTLKRASKNCYLDRELGLPNWLALENEVAQKFSSGQLFSAIFIRIKGKKKFEETYGERRLQEVVKFLADVLVLQIDSAEEELIGSLGEGDFLFLTVPRRAANVASMVLKKFDNGKGRYYPPTLIKEEALNERPSLNLSIAIVSNHQASFQDFDQMREAAEKVWQEEEKLAGSVFMEYRAKGLQTGRA